MRSGPAVCRATVVEKKRLSDSNPARSGYASAVFCRLTKPAEFGSNDAASGRDVQYPYVVWRIEQRTAFSRPDPNRSLGSLAAGSGPIRIRRLSTGNCPGLSGDCPAGDRPPFRSAFRRNGKPDARGQAPRQRGPACSDRGLRTACKIRAAGMHGFPRAPPPTSCEFRREEGRQEQVPRGTARS